MKARPLHNTHLLIPEKLWAKASRRATSEGKTFTQLVCEGLEAVLDRKRKASRR